MPAPPKLKLKILLNPVSFTIICPKLNSLSVAFAVKLITSPKPILVKDSFKVAFTTGTTVSRVKLM